MSDHSIPAARVAQEVLETLGKGEKPNIGQIAIRHGYTPKTANSGAVTATKSYRDVMAAQDIKTSNTLRAHRKAILKNMKVQVKTAKYRDLVNGLDITTKNERLLSGASTENIETRGSVVMLPSAAPENGSIEPPNA